MSIKIHRPRITGLTVAADDRSTSGSRALSELLSSLSTGARAAYRGMQQAREEIDGIQAAQHRPLASLRQADAEQTPATAMPSTPSDESLPAAEAAKVDVLRRAAPYRVARHHALDAPLQALRQADSLDAARQAGTQVMSALQTEHHRLFTERLVTACARASVKAGFPTVETQTRPDGLVRVLATNAAGNALVSEVKSRVDAEPSLATEVVGIHDGSCNDVMDAFDEALEEEGVRAATPRRTFTGGVCELAAARAFVQRKMRASAPAAGADEPSGASEQRDEAEDRRKKKRRRRARRRNRQR